MRLKYVLPLCLALLVPAAPALVVGLDGVGEKLISEALINRHGLTRAWLAQVSIDSRSSKLAHVKLFVDRTRNYVVHEISYENRKEYISEHNIDAGGQLLGVEGAKKKVAHRLLFLKGKNPVVVEKTLPETYLVCVSSNGTVQVIDAETGRTRWSKLIGNPRFDMLAPAVTDHEIGVVSGNKLHLVRTHDGLPLKTIQLNHVAAAGPAIAEGWAYIPRIDGTMDWYPIADQTKIASWFRGTGRLETQPSLHPGYVTWVTEKGYLYALNSFTQKVQFEIPLVGKPVASPVYAGDYKIVVATQAGYVVCIDLRTSTVLWRYSTGEPMIHQPLVVGDHVYAVNTTGTLTKLLLSTGVNIDTGDVDWTSSGVKQLLASANGRIYAIDTLRSLVAIDPASGSIVDRIPLEQENGMNIYNATTNRLLIANREGLVQSLRATSQVFPEIVPGALETAINGDLMTVKKKPAAEPAAPKTTEPSDKPSASPSDNKDPFSTPPAGGEKKPGGDPFGG